MLIARVDVNECFAQGVCEAIAPQAFRLDEVAVVIGEAPDDLMLEAAEACPAVAITLVDADDGETVYP